MVEGFSFYAVAEISTTLINLYLVASTMASTLSAASTAAHLFKIPTLAVMIRCCFDVDETCSCTLTRKPREKSTNLQFDLNICAKATITQKSSPESFGSSNLS